MTATDLIVPDPAQVYRFVIFEEVNSGEATIRDRITGAILDHCATRAEAEAYAFRLAQAATLVSLYKRLRPPHTT